MAGAGLSTASAARTAPDGALGGWLDRVRDQIGRGEYYLSPRDAGGWTAPNRDQGLRLSWHEGVLQVQPRLEESTWVFTHEFHEIRRGDQARQLAVPDDERCYADRLEWQRGDVVEWYVNDERGIEQGLTIPIRLRGDGEPIVIEADIDGLLAIPADDGSSVVLRTASGADALRIRDLVVTDATGTELRACLAVGVGALQIWIDDRGAAYPLTVDPLFTGPAWTAESNQPYSNFAGAVATAGDVNGDGYSDVIVGAPTYDNGQVDEGRAFVYHGSASGLATVAAWHAESDIADAELGFSVAPVGDVNGDGFADVLVGAPFLTADQRNEGRAYLFLGSASGLRGTPAWTADGDQDGAHLGDTLTGADVNGDGFSDVFVAAGAWDGGERDEGRIVAWSGSAAGLPTSPSWIWEPDEPTASLSRISAAGDVNGDGYADVIAGAPGLDASEENVGGAFAFFGSVAGPGSSPDWSVRGDESGAFLGTAVASAGDVNGDGYADLVLGAKDGAAGLGEARVYCGSPHGPSLLATWTAPGEHDASRFGMAVACAGDVNGDGFADVLVGAAAFDGGENDEGKAYLYHGSSSGLGSSPAWTTEGDQEQAEYGATLGTAGDIDGDGFSDVIVGGIGIANPEPHEGRAFVYRGSASGLSRGAGWVHDGEQAGSALGISVASAGDVNGDGFSDVLVGAHHFDNGQDSEGRAFAFHGSPDGLSLSPAWTAEGNQVNAEFGACVGTAGDVNGDGYTDVIIGAVGYANPNTAEGAAFLYLGSNAGLASSPSWSFEGEQVRAILGRSVGTAGDVNGDGYSDVLIGAPLLDGSEMDEGAAFVFHGSPSGLSSVPAWTADGGQAGAQLGWSTASAGDVNADGFSDVIVGAFTYDDGQVDEGRAVAFLGSASGLSTSPAWSVEGGEDRAYLGYVVAHAGDVDGDGFSDVVVGVPEFDSGDGRALAYHGSPSGLSPAPLWIVEGDQPDADFGACVSSAGDVNGDGYSDVAVGAWLHDDDQRDEGRALVYHGSASGLSTAPAWTADGDQTFAFLGLSIAMAGDVNGDGYSDVLVGAHGHDISPLQTGEGRALLYFGNSGDGLDRAPRQRRHDDFAPIDLLGLGESTDGFLVRARARSPYGRDRVRLELEVKRLAVAFDGTGLEITPFTDTGAPGVGGSFVDIGIHHAPMGGGPWHWRARLRGTFPLPWLSHWLTLPGNAITETDLRSHGANLPPSCNAGGAVTTECGPVELVAASASDPDGDVLAYSWTHDCDGDGTFEGAGRFSDPTALRPTIDPPDGCGSACTVRLEVSDGAATCVSTSAVLVTDTTPPDVAPDPNGDRCIWPPHHGWSCFGRVDFAPVITDACSGPAAWEFVGCASDQATDDGGDGHTTADCVVAPDGGSFCLRGERDGRQPAGRAYVVTIVARDACGNVSDPVALGTVHVPRDAREYGACAEVSSARSGSNRRRSR